MVLALQLVAWCGPSLAEEAPSRTEAAQALRQAVRYFREEVSTRGGYLWEYSADLSQRRGEAEARPSQIWVQPPGTPSVGLAFLRTYQRTGDDYYLDASRGAAHALAWGQLASGGWAYDIDFDPERSQRRLHRRDVEAGQADPSGRFNTTTFDDDTSQSALRLLMCFDRVTRFEDEIVHRSAMYALDHFLKAQYPSGGWPQRFTAPCDPADWPVRPARYPESWSRTWPKPDYKSFYTLNDHTIPDLIDTMLLALDIYGHESCLDAARRGGDFLVLAQMPEPQPAWAQQYDADMTPAWARRFEPPSVVSTESVTAIRVLMTLYVRTGEDKYRRLIPRALEWFERSRLPDGRHARFYELQTNRPLYFTKDYQLVYKDDDLPTHYAFKTRIDVAGLRRQYDQLDRRRQQHLQRRQDADEPFVVPGPSPKLSAETVRAVIDALDAQGRWVTDGQIRCSDFIHNVDVLSGYMSER